MLTFRDTNKSFKIDGDHLKTKTTYNFNVDQSNPHDRKIPYEFGVEMKCNIKQKTRKSNRGEPLMKLLQSPAIMVSGISTVFLPENLIESCDRLKLLQQEKQAGNLCNIFDEDIVAMSDKLIEYKRISTKQPKVLLVKCLN